MPNIDMQQTIEDSFIQYAGAVLQSRALVDVRDCLKPSARQIFYCLQTDKFTHSKPFKKTLKCIGSAMRMYIHGDSSCEGIIMRAGQPFAMRYPLVEVDGSYGNLMESGNWAAPRYTSSRLSEISTTLFQDIEKETIDEWRDNYDDTEQYPAVLPTKGFYNIVNGGVGIGVGAAFSCPQFNIKEVNDALIKLLWNNDCSFDDIYCAPDFATGAILLNEKEVKESLMNGTGPACKLRAVVEFDSTERCFIVTEIPYGVYTNTICGELEAILNNPEDNPGIERFNDLTGSKPLIKIYLSKRANPDKVLRYLYKNTSLQSHFGVNLTMLDNGRFPRVFAWKEALLEYLNHQYIVYKRSFQFDLNKIQKRLHIIEGLLIATARIEEVIQTIKSSSSTAQANKNLQDKFLLSEAQAKAILDMKLSKLASLEVQKIEKEKADLLTEENRIQTILNNEELFKKEIEKDLKSIANKFGDNRRTKILNTEDTDDEPMEVKTYILNLTNKNNLYVSESSALYTQRRGGVGAKLKLDKGEFISSTLTADTTDTILFFTNKGNFYHAKAAEIALDEKIAVEMIIPIKDYEKVCAMTAFNESIENNNIIIFTKQGMMKKSALSEYNTRRAGGLKAIELSKDDEICSVLLMNDERVGLLSAGGQLMICKTEDVRPIGRVAKGVKGIKLNDGDYVVSVRKIPEYTKEFVTITEKGYTKRTEASECGVTGRYTKGTKVHKLKDDTDKLVNFLPITDEKTVIFVSSRAQLRTDLSEISLLGKGAQGIRSIKMNDTDKIIGILKI